VIVATPDHWHYLAAVEAIRNKKDVYGEKPITHTYAEAKQLVEEVKKHERIWQTGSQQRSEFTFHRGAELVRNGVLGKIKEVEVGLPQGRSGHKKGAEVVSDPPANVDYDMWCGPAPKLPFMKSRFHFDWRWNLAFGGGQLLDWICHHNDIAHWGLDEDLGGPLELEAVDWKWPEDKTVFDAPYEYKVISTYAKDIKVTIASDNFVKHGCKWIGENGWVPPIAARSRPATPSGSRRSSIRARSSCTRAATISGTSSTASSRASRPSARSRRRTTRSRPAIWATCPPRSSGSSSGTRRGGRDRRRRGDEAAQQGRLSRALEIPLEVSIFR
jgi:hypothetical protein